MYTLTLTKEERAAFDWIGGQYPAPEAVADAFRRNLPEDVEWSGPGTLTVNIPEHEAWLLYEVVGTEINEHGTDPFPCFCPALHDKLVEFVDSIV